MVGEEKNITWLKILAMKRWLGTCNAVVPSKAMKEVKSRICRGEHSRRAIKQPNAALKIRIAFKKHLNPDGKRSLFGSFGLNQPLTLESLPMSKKTNHRRVAIFFLTECSKLRRQMGIKKAPAKCRGLKRDLDGTRTHDSLIKSQVLYRLSYEIRCLPKKAGQR